MVEAIVVGAVALTLGAALVFVAAFAVLVVSPLGNEKIPLRFVSPARAWPLESVPSGTGKPSKSGFVNGLIRWLGVVRKANQGIQRDAAT
jgi:hypothetical protein